jgi:hypothetical protein
MSQENNPILSEEEINGYIRELDELFQSLIPIIINQPSSDQKIYSNQ